MTTVNVPTRSEVSAGNQAIFDQLQKALGFVPNLYATFAHSETALGDYLALQNRKSSLSGKEREIINLVVSQVNDCSYCLSAHTAVGKMQGFTEEQIINIRQGSSLSDAKFDALANLVRSVAIGRGKPDPATVATFFTAGYDKANLVDVVIVVGDKIITNYLHGITQVAVDFPAAPAIA